MADDFSIDDRRRTVNGGIRRGRKAAVEDLQAAAGVGFVEATGTVLATRGDLLSLTRARFSGGDDKPFENELLNVIEVDADDRMAAVVVFDSDDFEAAIAELDTRYLAVEGAAYRRTWSAVMEAHAAFNRRELPSPITELIDHRPVVTIHAGKTAENIRDMWEFTPDLKLHIESVHRLSERGAVVTQASHGTSQAGFEAEWRDVELIVVEGDLVRRCEVFGEGGLDAALARFEELRPQKQRLENAAAKIYERFWKCFENHDWDAVSSMLATDHCSDDRRRVVGAGIRHGREAVIEDMGAVVAQFGGMTSESVIVATRGDRLALRRVRISGQAQRPGTFDSEFLNIVEIDADSRIATLVFIDAEDFDSAVDELDARYMAGEAAAHSQTWSALTQCFASINRRELPETTPDWVNIDHRRSASAATGELAAFLSTTWDQTPELTNYVEAVHRLSDTAIVITYAARGTSQEGFDAEWRVVNLFMFDGEQVSRVELFDESDLGEALEKFDELTRATPQLENAASRAFELTRATLAARDWGAMAELLAANTSNEDRRRVLNAEVRLGRDSVLEDLRASVEVIGITYAAVSVIATRGERLVLVRARLGNKDRPEEVLFDVLQLIELDDEERVAAVVTFDADDLDAAFREIDGRYAAKEASPCAHTYTVVARAYAALNRREVPSTTPDWANTDHRHGATVAPGDRVEFVRAAWELERELYNYIQTVHRVNAVGAVVTRITIGTSDVGFDAERRTIDLMTVDGDLVSRFEMFDEGDLDAALARFDELAARKLRTQNAASEVDQRFWRDFAARDWDNVVHMVHENVCIDDRRSGVNAGIAYGRDAHLADLHAIAEVGAENTTSAVIATRGDRLALTRVRSSYRGLEPTELGAEVLCMVEIDADHKIVRRIGFDLTDIDAAFAELDARYLVGDAAPHAGCWSAITRICTALNRRKLPETTAGWVSLDHRRGASIAPGDWTADIRAAWQQATEINFHISAVHRLSGLGAVMTGTADGTSREGFEAEWRLIALLLVTADTLRHIEIFDESDLDAALARFGEM